MKEWLKKNWIIITLLVLSLIALFLYVGLYNFEKAENKRQYGELLDVRGALHGLENDYELLQKHYNDKGKAYDSLYEENESLKNDYQLIMEGDFAVFNIKGTAKVRELDGDEVYDVDITERHLALSPTSKKSSPYFLLHREEIVEISLEITTPDGVLYINNEESHTITDIGTYNVMIVGSGGYHTATLMVGGF